ncbi:MAG: MiaB/RimO family radical SAM methylthiotransferase [Planctomycetota bacterium]|nr:MiaB/RimO family radical SAM methylthiotransferase [Planctomycetota bacterium]
MRIFLETFGCQMNELDSELVRSNLVSLGYEFVDHPEEAKIILFNTCSVRELAEQKAWSRIGIVGQRKKQGEELILGVLGCMAERDGLDLLRRHPQVDILCGPGELDRLPQLLHTMIAAEGARPDRADRVALLGSKNRRSSTLEAAQDGLESLDLARTFDPAHSTAGSRSAYVRITRGCNKFCTYCVVPNTRGAEVHRPPSHIVDECKKLADEGVIEVTLLGQTVNHYVYTHGVALSVNGAETPQIGPGLSAFRPRHTQSNGSARVTTFADLLHRIHEEVPALQRIRFVTSYPRDFSDDALAVMRDDARICPYLHAPAQSGSDRILKMMNRGYSVGEYLEFIDRAIATVPNLCIAGDIIVGFPTETESDFEATCDLVNRVPYKNNYIFKYSPRPGTPAFDRIPNDVPEEIKRWRNNQLLALQAQRSQEVHDGWIGKTVPVFFQEVRRVASPKTANTSMARAQITIQGKDRDSAYNSSTTNVLQLVGRTPGDLIVAVESTDNNDSRIGTIEPVTIHTARSLLLLGSTEANAGS